MNQLRRIAICLIAVGLVTSAIYATGAFDSATTKRNANVNVVGDAAGYLGLQPADGENGQYATDKGGELALRLDGTLEDGPAGSGVNQGSQTVISDIFTITNQGTQPVESGSKTRTTSSSSSRTERRLSPKKMPSSSVPATPFTSAWQSMRRIQVSNRSKPNSS